jgi:hypothetical protein
LKESELQKFLFAFLLNECVCGCGQDAVAPISGARWREYGARADQYLLWLSFSSAATSDSLRGIQKCESANACVMVGADEVR